AAEGRPRKSRRDARVLRAQPRLGEEPPFPEQRTHPRRRDRDLALRLSLRELASGVAADRADLPFQVPDARLAGVLVDDDVDRLVLELDPLLRQPVALDLAGNQVA